MYSTRKALADRNYPNSNDTGFSQTTVSSATTAQGKGDATEEISLDSVGLYNEFAVSNLPFLFCAVFDFCFMLILLP